ncbi:general substrate transporter [Hygrophoropsis aurantiaca]|uniref:General substrate transporter n=1 Tax=Hygrophoropsis aurantiaca TaxID=72124 RepID=A0ACB8A1P6_9AGAM|nr:general substrate transporter [Hygrophoropsis aurantiaca]
MGLFYNIFVALFSAIGAFLFGQTLEQFTAYFNNPNNALLGAVVSTFNGGCFFGAMGAAWTNDKWGRKRSIQFGSVWTLCGCAMQAGASSIGVLLAGRIIGGVGIGILSMTVPLYNTEIAPPKIRGFMVGLTQQMLGIGFIVANWVGYGCAYLQGDISWRLPLGLQLVPAFLLLVGIQFLPFSPRWLLEHDRDDEARAVVYRLYGTATPEAKEVADREYTEMHDQIKADALMRSRRFSDLWATRAMMRRTMVSVGVQVFTQFTGINVINYYGPQMYEALGLSNSQSLLVQGIYGAVGPIANLFFIIFILDSVGRKRPLMFGAGSFVVTFSILAALVASYPPGTDLNLSAQKAAIAMIFLTSIIFSLSFGPVSWVLASEVFPTRTRSIGTSAATCANWIFNVLLSETSPIGLADVGYKFYILFVCLNAFDFVMIAMFFPETKGKSLEEMAVIFGDEVDARQVLEDHMDGSENEKKNAVMVERF